MITLKYKKRLGSKEAQERIEKLEFVIQHTFWMARRYAHGRSTYAPSLVRECYQVLKQLGIKINHDVCIEPPKEHEVKGMRFREDFLDDTNGV